MALLDWPNIGKNIEDRIDLNITEIKAPYIIEVIAERFDYQSMALMTRSAFVYGGAVRDALAGMPILGDLDIAAASSEYSKMVKAFSSSLRWIRRMSGSPRPFSIREAGIRLPENGPGEELELEEDEELAYEDENIEEEDEMPNPGEDVRPSVVEISRTNGETIEVRAPNFDGIGQHIENTEAQTRPQKIKGVPRAAKGGLVAGRARYTRAHDNYVKKGENEGFHIEEHENPYNKKAVPMSGMSVFETLNGVKAHIICSKKNSRWDGGAVDAALHLVRHVDIVCCGVAMNRDGQVFEVIKGAHEDCKNRVLRLNKETENIHIPQMIKRIDSLVKRGWKNEIDIKEAEELLKEVKARAKKQHDRAEKDMKEAMEKTHQLKKRPRKESKNTFSLSDQLYDDIFAMEMSQRDKKSIIDYYGKKEQRDLSKKEVVDIWLSKFDKGMIFLDKILDKKRPVKIREVMSGRSSSKSKKKESDSFKISEWITINDSGSADNQ